MQRYGKSNLMCELAKRFPGKVVHVTPETLPKRQRDPMIGDVVVDESKDIRRSWDMAKEVSQTVYMLFRDGQFHECTKAEYETYIAESSKALAKAYRQPQQED